MRHRPLRPATTDYSDFRTVFALSVHGLLLATFLLAGVVFSLAQTPPTIITCTTGSLPHGDKMNPPDLVIITGPGCIVDAKDQSGPNKDYYFHNVNIFGGGKLTFTDVTVDFWAESILVQNNGTLVAGSRAAPIGTPKSDGTAATLTIHLWGKDLGGDATPNSPSHQKGGAGIACLTTPDGGKTFTADPMCGVPSTIWTSNPMGDMNPQTPCIKSTLPSGTGTQPLNDCFYQYGTIDYDDGDPNGYFGYKVLALSYGGTLQLFGYKGATYPLGVALPLPAWNSGLSWVRLAKDAHAGDQQITIDRAIGAGRWAKNDQIVLTSTDYMPGHSEQLTVDSVDTKDPTLIHLQGKVQWPHNGTKYDLNKKSVPASVGPTDDPNLPAGNGRQVDTRAAVGLLTRSIRIVSGGDNAGDKFPDEPDYTKDTKPGYYFGGHTIVRQGFNTYQVEGVEFYQLGQGGRIMHYPVHFHMARQTPQAAKIGSFDGTYIKDTSVWDSMTRWYTLHATQGVALWRNVGYKSIGHGYYLEDATETNNLFYSNLGVLARAAVKAGNNPPPPSIEDGAQAQNPRQVPGIFAGGYPMVNHGEDPNLTFTTDFVAYNSDAEHPSIFWITNGWNSFQYNMAASANACGVCYWLQPAGNSGMSRWEYWEGYASEQRMFTKADECDNGLGGNDKKTWICDDFSFAGTTPLAVFNGNTCSTAMSSFLEISVTTACRGVVPNPSFPHMELVENPKIPPTPYEIDICPGDMCAGKDADRYYPKIDPAGARTATLCPLKGNCNLTAHQLDKCANGQLADCAVTAIDHYTSSFNWAEQNFSAIWLRPQWNLVSNSAITDVQTGGLTMITGGDYTASSVIPGYWGVARNNVFVGHTQADAGYTSSAGPFNQSTKATLQCEGSGGNPNFCLNRVEGMTMPLSNFAVNQRLYSIYDGPSYQDSNAFLDINKTVLDGCKYPITDAGCANPAGGQGWMYGFSQGLPLDPVTQSCYMPNAAIAWKQPNGFFYPPAFHSNNLYFNNVDIRHFVIDPPFTPTDYLHPFHIDTKDLARYCTESDQMFGGFGGGSWSAIDRQTELTDDDGSLTGLVSKQTGSNQEVISVNIERFFRAPYEDTECGSNLNTPPLTSPLTKDPAGTALSSPYQYVTTVVYPDCATNGKSCGTVCVDKCGTPQAVNVSRWALDCTNQTCYGVPLWRQFQTGYDQTEEAADPTNPAPPPFIMMMGAAIDQRDTLTVNHGKYFIDTTVSINDQYAAMSTNPTNKLFQNYTTFTNWQTPGPYYVFLLYAKQADPASGYQSTVQTYQTFVGAGLATAANKKTEQDVADEIAGMVQVDKSNKPFKPKPGTWPTKWARTYDNTTGFLTVTMDFSDTSLDFTATQCQPASFCKSTGKNTCGCSISNQSQIWTKSLQAQCNVVCSQWAAKDIDCPDAGCYGFSVDLTKSTTFSDATHVAPPKPDCFPNATDWNAGFNYSTVEKGACDYHAKGLPTADFTCK